MTTLHPTRAYEEVVAFFATGPSREEISAFRLSEETITRLRRLLLKSSAGTLTAHEVEELEQCIQLDRLLLLIRARALAQRTWRDA